MTKRDINLFKAAGGDKSKGAKRSASSYVTILVLVVIIAMLGATAYFNFQRINAQKSYDDKAQTLNDYDATLSYVKDKADMYKSIKADIESAKAINAVIGNNMLLYPRLQEGEVNAVKATILGNPSGVQYDLNLDNEGKKTFKAVDYNAIRATFAGEVISDERNRSLYYDAFEALANEQAALKSKKKSAWYTYYRGYFVMCFAGGTEGTGLAELVASFNADYPTMDGLSPFITIELEDEAALPKYTYVKHNDRTYNLVLYPIKDVFWRALDVLEAQSAILAENYASDYALYDVASVKYEWEGAEPGEGAAYTVTGRLELTLIIKKLDDANPNARFRTYCTAFNNSGFFTVDDKVIDKPTEDSDGENLIYDLTLNIVG